MFKWKCFCINEPELSVDISRKGRQETVFYQPVVCPLCREVWRVSRVDSQVDGKLKTTLQLGFDNDMIL